MMSNGLGGEGTEDRIDIHANDVAICKEILSKKLVTMRLRFDALELIKEQMKIGTITLPSVLPVAFYTVLLHGPAAVGICSRGAFPDSIGARMIACFLTVPPGSWFALCQSLTTAWNGLGGANATTTRLVPALAASTMMNDPTLRRAITAGVDLAKSGAGDETLLQMVCSHRLVNDKYRYSLRDVLKRSGLPLVDPKVFVTPHEQWLLEQEREEKERQRFEEWKKRVLSGGPSSVVINDPVSSEDVGHSVPRTISNRPSKIAEIRRSAIFPELAITGEPTRSLAEEAKPTLLIPKSLRRSNSSSSSSTAASRLVTPTKTNPFSRRGFPLPLGW
jgi:hypothetical protein